MSQFINYENEKKINYIIDNLPSDLVKKIYVDYIKPQLIYTDK
jgi:hypothetical protein